MVAAATLTADGRCYFRQKYFRGAKFLAQEKAGEGRLGSRGVWTQRKGEGEEGALFALPPLRFSWMEVGGMEI